MPENLIKFQEARDFGGILNATFAFLKENFQPLAIIIFTYCLPFIILTAVVYGTLPIFMGSPLGMLFYSFIGLLGSLIYSTALFALIYQYVMFYIARGYHNFTPKDVWESSLKNLGVIFSTLVGYTIIVVIGCFLLLLPGIYWAICFSMVFIIRLNEGKDFSEARQRCLELLKGNNDSIWNNWFKLFGLFVIIIFLSIIIGYTMQNILGMIGLNSEEILKKNVGSYSFILVIATILETIIASFLQSFSIIAISFQYFSLLEERDSLDLRNQIESFGQNSV